MSRRLLLSVFAAVALALIGPAQQTRADGPPRSGDGWVPPGPAQALAASATYPGLGQLLNGAEPKAAVVGGVEAFLVARLVLEDRWTRHSLRLYNETGEGRHFDAYSRHFDTRQTLMWWVIVAALFGMADAYVDAHLDSFEVSTPAGLEGEAAGPASSDSGGDFRVGVALRF